MPSFIDNGTYNLRDLGTNVLVGKVHVEPSAADAAGGRGYIMHYALLKVDPSEAGWGIYVKPTQNIQKSYRWEGTGETLAQFLNWMGDATRKSKIRYTVTGMREQDVVP